MLEMLILKAEELMVSEPDAFHILTIDGLFTTNEMQDLKAGIIGLLKPGHVIPVINSLYPVIYEETGRWSMTDFVTSPQLPKNTLKIFRNESVSFKGTGPTPAEFLEKTPPPPELDVEQKITRTLAEIGI